MMKFQSKVNFHTQNVCLFLRKKKKNACFLALPVLMMPKRKANFKDNCESLEKLCVFRTLFTLVQFKVWLVCPLVRFDKTYLNLKTLKGSCALMQSVEVSAAV